MIKFEQSTPGSWATFDILVNDGKRFFASNDDCQNAEQGCYYENKNYGDCFWYHHVLLVYVCIIALFGQSVNQKK